MTYNLLDEPWIPVIRESGHRDWIAPYQIAELDDPPVALASVRADFDGALLQFLIGILQTASAPHDESAWRRRIVPPDPEELRKEFAEYHQAFELLGDGPRFMQEASIGGDAPTDLDVARLLLDVPGEQTLEQNADVFVKRNGDAVMGLPVAAAALLTLQLNAPSGGKGYRTSLRGGGPLTTVLTHRTLWLTTWLNVLPAGEFMSRGGNSDLEDVDAHFPWMGPPQTSANKEEIGPTRIHPSHQFWATPRRVLFQSPVREGQCSYTGRNGLICERMLVKSYGANYKGAFDHPLTPYTAGQPGGVPNPKKLNTDGLPYRDWPLYTLGHEKVQPARVIAHAIAKRRLDEVRRATGSVPMLHAFGYSMDNAKAEAWFAGSAPILELPEHEQPYRRRVAQAVGVAEEVRRTLNSCVLEAIKRRPDDVKDKYNNAIAANISRSFWSDTEAEFFKFVGELRDLYDRTEDDEAAEARMRVWVEELQRSSRRLFEDFSQERGDFAACDVRRVSEAWNRLLSFTSLRNRRIQEAAGLPVDEEANPPRTRKGKK